MVYDVILRNGTVVDGTGGSARQADVAVLGDRIAEVTDLDEGGISHRARREIDVEGRLVTPGFIDVHTQLDAQIVWDPSGAPATDHGVTSVVMGNCGLSLAPLGSAEPPAVAEMLETFSDVPREAYLEGLSWEWRSYGEYLSFLARQSVGPNVGGMVGHAAIRLAVMGERAFDDLAKPDDLAAMVDLVDEAMTAGALGFSTSRTYLHRVPDGRPLPGSHAHPDELCALADVLGRHRKGVVQGAMRLGERDGDDLANTRAEVETLGEISRRSGRTVTFGVLQSNRRPDLFRTVIEIARGENEDGAHLRPQTPAHGVGMLFSLDTRTPFDEAPAWQELQTRTNGRRLQMLRDPAFRQRLISEADVHGTGLDLSRLYVLEAPDSRYDPQPERSLHEIALARGVSPGAAFIELCMEHDGHLVMYMPILNEDLSAVAEMLDDDLVALGMSEAGAHVRAVMDADQPTFLLAHWVRDERRWSVEEAVRRLTSDPADLFDLGDRGRLHRGAYADINVIDLDALTLPPPEFVRDLPTGAGRFVQRAGGYDYTFVNGQPFREFDEPTGEMAGRVLRPN